MYIVHVHAINHLNSRCFVESNEIPEEIFVGLKTERKHYNITNNNAMYMYYAHTEQKQCVYCCKSGQ